MCAANWAIVLSNTLSVNKCLKDKGKVTLSSQTLLDCTKTTEIIPCTGYTQNATFFNALEYEKSTLK